MKEYAEAGQKHEQRNQFKQDSGNVPVKVKKLNKHAVIPKYAKPGDAGFDLHACIEHVIWMRSGESVVFGTGLAVEIPEGYELQIRGRSGLAFRHHIGITHGVGTIDSGFRGEIKIVLTNHGSEPYPINPGDRIGQGVLNKIPVAEFVEVDNLSDTERGKCGFGSTGY